MILETKDLEELKELVRDYQKLVARSTTNDPNILAMECLAITLASSVASLLETVDFYRSKVMEGYE